MKPKYRNLIFAATALFAVSSAHAQTGIWTNTATSSTWSTAGNWSGNVIANGSGNTADFTTGFTANTTATLDTSRSIGHIIKDDTNGTLNTFTIAASGAPASILTLATGGPVPTITNSDLGGGGRMDISAQLSGTQGLEKLGVGNVHLTNAASAWSGNTTVTGGLLHLGAANLANIGGGSGRNISVAAGTAIGINGLTNAGLNRIVETAAEISVLTTTSNNALDFTSATGANLSGAFLGSNLTNGGKAEIQGIITMANNYRLGAVDGYQNGTFGIRQESLLSGTNGLIVGGNRVVIVGTHTFTGDTTLRDGARLGLSGLDADGAGLQNNSRALQNSVLDLGAPSSTGLIFLEGGNAGGIAGLTTSANGGTSSATFGGLKGSRDLNSAFLFTGPGNNTSAKAATAINGFTLNVGTSVTATYSGAIGGFGTGATGATLGASTLTKTGLGTQVLSGNSTYTGATLVSAGTLLVNGSLGNTAVTVNGGAFGGTGAIGSTLDLEAGSFYVVDLADALVVAGAVDIYAGFGVDDLANITWGSVLNGTYTLIDGTLGGGVFAGLANNSVGTAFDIGGGRSAYFQEGSLELVVADAIPEPSAALLGAFGMLALLRRRRN